MQRALLSLAIATVTAMPAAHAADTTNLTIYRSDDAGLYTSGDEGSISSGYALVHERRRAELAAGTQTIHFDGLPASLDTEALDVDFPGGGVDLLSRRLLLPGNSGLLAGHLGEQVKVFGSNGNVLAQGVLRSANDGLVVVADGATTVVRDYASVQLAGDSSREGARLDIALRAAHAGAAEARLDYPTGGFGWRAAYTGMLHEDGACRLDLRSDASIANRSGRDWNAAALKLVAGEPNFAKASSPQPMMMRASAMAMPAPAAPPTQQALGDYRSYTIDGAVDLPDASVTQVPLYRTLTLDCQRTWLFENGSAWTPSQPMLTRDFNRGGDRISSRLAFTAFDSLPAGYLRVLGDAGGQRELLGEARIADTPKDRQVEVELGTPFDLRGTREQTKFDLDKAAHTMDEAFRIMLTNAGDAPRTITVREHPTRWRNWTLVSSSAKPTEKSVDTLEFAVAVPAHGKATLDYAVRYTWTSADD